MASSFNSTIKLTVSSYVERKQQFAQVSFVPIRKNPTTGVIEKLTEFKINTQLKFEGSAKSAAPSTFSNQSVLSSGTWYKVGVTKSGVAQNYISRP